MDVTVATKTLNDSDHMITASGSRLSKSEAGGKILHCASKIAPKIR